MLEMLFNDKPTENTLKDILKRCREIIEKKDSSDELLWSGRKVRDGIDDLLDAIECDKELFIAYLECAKIGEKVIKELFKNEYGETVSVSCNLMIYDENDVCAFTIRTLCTDSKKLSKIYIDIHRKLADIFSFTKYSCIQEITGDCFHYMVKFKDKLESE